MTTSPVTVADVVVVGGGVGGCAAAVEATRAGAKAVVVEAGPTVGGNAARSTGYLAFADTTMQRAAGINDSPEAFLADIEAEIHRQEERYGIVFDRALARRFAEESSSTFDFLVDLGVEFGRFIPRPKQHTVDRMVNTVDVEAFRTGFEDLLTRLDVPVLTDTRALRLTTDESRVAGIVASSDGGRDELRIVARHAVVLAAGGYQGNTELRRRHQPSHLAEGPYLGVDTDRGDGHVMGQAVGGDLVNMSMIPPLVMVASALVEDAFAVNRSGRRFHDEAGPYDDRVAALDEQPGRDAWYVFDDRVARDKAHLVEQMPETPLSASTVGGLARLLGIDAEGLEATFGKWQDMVAARRDDDHGRVVFTRSEAAMVPPLHASRMVVGINFPAGGFRVTTDLEVVDVFGRTIPGLFAVGDCVGGVSPAIGLGGLKITPAVTLGRVAGRVAAQRSGTSPRRVATSLMGGTETRIDRETRIAVFDEADRVSR